MELKGEKKLLRISTFAYLNFTNAFHQISGIKFVLQPNETLLFILVAHRLQWHTKQTQ